MNIRVRWNLFPISANKPVPGKVLRTETSGSPESGWNLDFRLLQVLNFTEKGRLPKISLGLPRRFFFMHDLTRLGKINIDKSRNIAYQLPQFPRNNSMLSLIRRYVTGSAKWGRRIEASQYWIELTHEKSSSISFQIRTFSNSQRLVLAFDEWLIYYASWKL